MATNLINANLTVPGSGLSRELGALLKNPKVEDASNASVTNPLKVSHATSGTPGTGIGVGLEFEAETAAGNEEVGATIEAVTTDVTAASEDFDVVVKTMAAGAAAAERLRINNAGLKVAAYGAGVVQSDASGNLTSATALASGTTATTQAARDNSTKLATTAYVDAADNPAWKLITRGTVTNAASLSLDVTPGTIGNFHAFKLVLSEWAPATDNVDLNMRFGDSGGIDSGATDYGVTIGWAFTDSTSSGDGSTGRAQIKLAEGIGNASGESYTGELLLNGNLADTPNDQVNWVTTVGAVFTISTGLRAVIDVAGGCRNVHIDLTTIQLLFSSGNISTGYYALYGIAVA